MSRVRVGAFSWDFLLQAALLVAAVVHRGDLAASEWPAFDMVPFFRRLEDPGFAPGDFFTDQSVLPNPRWVYGGLVWALSRPLGGDWYSALALLKAAQIVLFPALLLALGRRVLQKRLPEKARLGAWLWALAAAAGIYTGWFDRLCFAWWKPVVTSATPQGLAWVLGLGAALAWRRHAYASAALGAAATLVHPGLGALLFITGWAWLRPARFRAWRGPVYLLAAVLLPWAALALAFGAGSLPAREWVHGYCVVGHPFHYNPSTWLQWDPRPWPTILVYLAAGSALGAGLAWWAGRRSWARACAWMLALILGAVFLQWFGVEVWPSKALAALGPSRLVSLLPWTLTLAVAGGLAAVTPWPLRWNKEPQGLAPTAAVLASAVVAWVLLSPRTRDTQFDLMEEWRGSVELDLERWPAGSVIAVPPQPYWRYYFAVKGRPLYLSLGFPFNAEALHEQTERRRLIYGTPAEHQALKLGHLPPAARDVAHYRALGPEGFLRAAQAYPLHLAMVEEGHAQAFEGITPLLSGSGVKVYGIIQLREWARKKAKR